MKNVVDTFKNSTAVIGYSLDGWQREHHFQLLRFKIFFSFSLSKQVHLVHPFRARVSQTLLSTFAARKMNTYNASLRFSFANGEPRVQNPQSIWINKHSTMATIKILDITDRRNYALNVGCLLICLINHACRQIRCVLPDPLIMRCTALARIL